MTRPTPLNQAATPTAVPWTPNMMAQPQAQTQPTALPHAQPMAQSMQPAPVQNPQPYQPAPPQHVAPQQMPAPAYTQAIAHPALAQQSPAPMPMGNPAHHNAPVSASPYNQVPPQAHAPIHPPHMNQPPLHAPVHAQPQSHVPPQEQPPQGHVLQGQYGQTQHAPPQAPHAAQAQVQATYSNGQLPQAHMPPAAQATPVAAPSKSLLAKLLKKGPKAPKAQHALDMPAAATAIAPSSSLLNKNFALGALTGLVLGVAMMSLFGGNNDVTTLAQAQAPAQVSETIEMVSSDDLTFVDSVLAETP